MELSHRDSKELDRPSLIHARRLSFLQYKRKDDSKAYLRK